MNEQALKDRLKYIAREQQRSFQEVWKLLLLERFLVRVANSKHQNRLIFKGGLLLSYYLIISRETTDIDFLAQQVHAEIDTIEAILVEICEVDVDDGFLMSFQNITELDHSHMSYPGFRAKLDVRFGNIKDRIQIDIGIGDIVAAKKISWPLYKYKNQPFFEDSITLQAYPIETIFSEKLETIVSRGAVNSRMKDFHDILLMCRNDNLVDLVNLRACVNDTFNVRNTEMAIPITFSEDELRGLQTLWSAHVRTFSENTRVELALPDDITELLAEINTWLAKIE